MLLYLITRVIIFNGEKDETSHKTSQKTGIGGGADSSKSNFTASITCALYEKPSYVAIMPKPKHFDDVPKNRQVGEMSTE